MEGEAFDQEALTKRKEEKRAARQEKEAQELEAKLLAEEEAEIAALKCVVVLLLVLAAKESSQLALTGSFSLCGILHVCAASGSRPLHHAQLSNFRADIAHTHL